MKEQPLMSAHGVVPLASGLSWLYAGMSVPWGWTLALLPGVLFVATGTGLLLWPGDRRVPQYLVLTSCLAAPLAVPAFFMYGLPWAIALVVLAAASYMAAGYASLRHEPYAPGVPPPVESAALAAKVALDDGLLGYFVFTSKVPTGARARRMQLECEQIAELYGERNWRTDLTVFHPTPAMPGEVQIKKRSIYGHAFEHARFESRYQPWDRLPGAERWIAQKDNQRAHAWIVRHEGPPRPWLVCIHGYRMGVPWMDFGLFQPRWLHQKLGLNLLMPVLPLHGPRRIGLRSGDGFMDGDVPSFIHAEAQAIFDMRCWLRWLRETYAAPTVGVLGYSLGGYNTALLASVEKGLACAIAGIPLVDISAILWRHLPPLQLQYLESLGMTRTRVAEALEVISPLAMKPQLERARLHIFGGVADRLIPAGEVQRLAQHWQVEPVWFQGTHLSFGSEASVGKCIYDGLVGAGLVASHELAPGLVRQ